MKLNFNFLSKLPEKEKKITLSTKLTIVRIFLVPFIIFGMIYHYWKFTFLLIIISAVTDCLDGMLARMRNEKTILGAMLDPIADKLFILSCYFTLNAGCLETFKLPLWFTFLVFFKELLLVFGGFLLFSKGLINIKPTWLGKITMDIQTLFIVWIFINYFFNLQFGRINDLFIVFIVILILSSFYQYVKIGIKQIKFRTTL